MLEEKEVSFNGPGLSKNETSAEMMSSIDNDGAQSIDQNEFSSEVEEFFKLQKCIEHTAVLKEILDSLQPVDFREMAKLDDEKNVTQKHLRILSVQEVIRVAQELNCGLCRNQDFIYVFNGQYWQLLVPSEFEAFLGEASNRLGASEMIAKDYEFKSKLYKQFMSSAYLSNSERRSAPVLINLLNGTFEISEKGMQLREFRRQDFLKYQCPFEYNPDEQCPRWRMFLDHILPDTSRQLILAEFIGYVFTRHMKLEKTLILFGTGANGKSVFFDVINALLGKENVSNYSLESLGEIYFRPMIANKLLNYSSEMSHRIQADKFKQLTSGEPVEARLPYGQPMMLTDYARLAFNCNELPKDVEHTEAFFRRFLIVPFDVFIPEHERNPLLAQEIIKDELSGVFNWVLSGLGRLIEKGNFTDCEASKKILDNFRKESDSVAMFIEEEGYKVSNTHFPLKTLFHDYKHYCVDNGYRPLGRNNFGKRLAMIGIVIHRANHGKTVFLERSH